MVAPAPEAGSQGLLRGGGGACGQGGPVTPTRRGTGKVPPPRDRCFQSGFQPRGKRCFVFHQINVLLLLDVLTLSILLVKGEEVAGRSLLVTPGLKKAL